jgi:hypothetical protein
MSGQRGSTWLVACGLPIAKVAHLLKCADGSNRMGSALADAASDVCAILSCVAAYRRFAKYGTAEVRKSVEHLELFDFPLKSSTHVAQ